MWRFEIFAFWEYRIDRIDRTYRSQSVSIRSIEGRLVNRSNLWTRRIKTKPNRSPRISIVARISNNSQQRVFTSVGRLSDVRPDVRPTSVRTSVRTSDGRLYGRPRRSDGRPYRRPTDVRTDVRRTPDGRPSDVRRTSDGRPSDVRRARKSTARRHQVLSHAYVETGCNIQKGRLCNTVHLTSVAWSRNHPS